MTVPKVAFNYLLIEPDGDFDVLPSGFNALTHYDAEYINTWGTIRAVPQRLISKPREVHQLMRRRTEGNVHKARRLAGMSLPFDARMEARVGDRVIFSYTAKLNPDYPEFDGMLIVPYNMAFAVQRQARLIPLNGYLLISLEERAAYEEVMDGIYLEHDDVNTYGLGKVVAAGSPNNGYLDEEKFDDARISEGNIVSFFFANSFRVETDRYNTLNEGRQSSWFLLNRKDVLSWI